MLGQVPWGGADDADAAVAAARRAFDAGPWPRMHPRERGRVLQRLAELVEARRDELALLVSLEMGKPIRVAHEIELRALAGTLRLLRRDSPTRSTGRSPRRSRASWRSSPASRPGSSPRSCPWNFPLTMAGWKLAPALAAGCTVVLKPPSSRRCRCSAWRELALEAGLPPGVLNVVNGDGAAVGRRLGSTRTSTC